MDKFFNEHFENFVDERCEEILKKDNTYWNMIKQVSYIHNKLKLMLSKEQLELLDELETTIAKTHSHAETILYRQGLKDGIAIRNLTKNLTHHCYL